MAIRSVNNRVIIPERISAIHYKVSSFTRNQKLYNLRYNAATKRWMCDCPDTTKNNNPRCKHRQLLATWIATQEQAQLAHRQATQIAASLEPSPLESELHKALERIAALESQTEQRDQQIEALHSRLAFQQFAELQIYAPHREVSNLRKALQMQNGQIAEQADTIRILQVQQCKTNEHRFFLEKELAQAREEIRKIELKNVCLHEEAADEMIGMESQIKTLQSQVAQLTKQQAEQQRATPPSIEIKINGDSIKRTGSTKAAKAKKAEEAEPQRVQEVHRGGKIVAYKIDSALIKIVEGCIVGQCNCKDAQKGTVCLHEQEAWSLLKSR